MSKDRAIMDEDQNAESIQVFPMRPVVAGSTDGAFAPFAVGAALAVTLDVSDSTLLRFESRAADGTLTPVKFGIDSESDTLYELKDWDVIGVSAVDTVRFTGNGTDVTIYGRRA